MSRELKQENVLFDVVVTQTVATICEGDGDMTPYQAAFMAIAEHSADNIGEHGSDYSFPGADGKRINVSLYTGDMQR